MCICKVILFGNRSSFVGIMVFTSVPTPLILRVRKLNDTVTRHESLKIRYDADGDGS